MTGTRDMRWMRHSILWMLAMAVAVTMLLMLPDTANAVDPPGNNGTVKVDDVPFDEHPDNEPHVGCVFQIDFYGYDEGNFNADVAFRAVEPTLGGVLLTDTVFIGEDPAGGGTDLDGSATYDLSEALAGIEPHGTQGHHVRLRVDAEGSQGDDRKFKEFWVEDCVTSDEPSELPSDVPSELPSDVPSELPSDVPSEQPSMKPFEPPGEQPTEHGGIEVPTRIDTGAGGSDSSPSLPLILALLTLAGASVAGVTVRLIRKRA